MNLLFTRSQKRTSFFSIVPLRIGGTVTFKLKAEMELTEEEKTLVKRYSFSGAVLISSDTYEDLQRAFRPALLLGFLAFLLSAFLIPASGVAASVNGINTILFTLMVVPIVGVSTVFVMTIVYFFNLRKCIVLHQLLNGGRTFYCHSVVELDELEKELLDLGRRVHATLEKARDWGGREINPIPIGEPFYLPNEDRSHSQSVFEFGMQAAGATLGKMLKSKTTGNASKASVREPASSPTPRPTSPSSTISTQPTTPPPPPKPPSCLLYTSPSPRDRQKSRMPSSA